MPLCRRDLRLSRPPRPGWMRVGAFAAGAVLVAAGIADAAINPLAFITADKLIASGISLIGIGAIGKAK